MIRKLFIYASLILFGAFTINAFWLGFNDVTTIQLFDRLPVLIAPPHYTYLIFFAVVAINFVFFMTYSEEEKSLILSSNLQLALYLCNALIHVIVLYIWHNEQFMSAIVLQSALLLLTFSLYLTFPQTKQQQFYRVPIALIFGWQLFIFLLMVNITLINYEWYGFGLSHALWCVIFMTFGTFIVLYLKYQYADYMTGIVFIWFYIGIAYKNGFDALLVTAAALFLSGVMAVGIWLLKKNRTSA
jgi:hypothetical protein